MILAGYGFTRLTNCFNSLLSILLFTSTFSTTQSVYGSYWKKKERLNKNVLNYPANKLVLQVTCIL